MERAIRRIEEWKVLTDEHDIYPLPEHPHAARRGSRQEP